ncbi:MAG: hypothetical protein Q9226_005486 [Calogaya cf. arnoldii]
MAVDGGIPQPTHEFCIPSIYDNTALACRIYCADDEPPEGYKDPETARVTLPLPAAKGAIVAHNYWGSYDNTVVLNIVDELLNAGFTVGTFNLRKSKFRSKGKGTWTSKAEIQDYISFVGLFMYYLSGVFPPQHDVGPFDDFSGLTRIPLARPTIRFPTLLVLAGYSYGALLIRHLPTVPVVLSQFSKVLKGSAEAEIRKRAFKLAVIDAMDSPSPGLLAYFGFNPQWTKNEAEKHRKELKDPWVREKAKNSRSKKSLGRRSPKEDYIARIEVPTPRTAYLLISMRLGGWPSLVAGLKKREDMEMLDRKFEDNATLLIHGSWDGLTSEGHLTGWFNEIEGRSGGRCQCAVVDEAGHSWKQEGIMDVLKSEIQKFVDSRPEKQSEERTSGLATDRERTERSERVSNDDREVGRQGNRGSSQAEGLSQEGESTQAGETTQAGESTQAEGSSEAEAPTTDADRNKSNQVENVRPLRAGGKVEARTSTPSRRIIKKWMSKVPRMTDSSL